MSVIMNRNRSCSYSSPSTPVLVKQDGDTISVRQSSTNKPLTVASVPTGINVGVFIFPLGVLIIPSLAFLNFEIRLNENSFFFI